MDMKCFVSIKVTYQLSTCKIKIITDDCKVQLVNKRRFKQFF